MGPGKKVAGLLGVAAITIAATPPPRTVSPSRQFIIYGGETELRGAVSETAERVKSALRARLRASDDWKTPILINLEMPQANLPELPKTSLRLSQTGAGLKLQLDYVVTRDMRSIELERQILRAVLLERMYRRDQEIAPGTAYVEPPPWLVEGLLELDDAPSGSPEVPLPDSLGSLPAFLQEYPDQLDSGSRAIYRTCATALVTVLSSGADGPTRLANFIDNLATAPGDIMTEMVTLFPNLSPTDLEGRWHAAALNRSHGAEVGMITFAQTESRLKEALQIKVEGKSMSLDDFARPKLSALEKAALKQTVERLMLVGAAANPLLRPVIAQYQEAAQRLSAGKWKGQRAHLGELHELEKRVARRLGDLDDYMNWFEATQSPELSGVFRNYMRAARATEEAPRRRDAMSVYLDAMEMEMDR